MLNQIKEIVIRKTGVDIEKSTRRIKFIEPRAIYYRLARDYTDYSLSQIGSSLKCIKDHSTVLHACRMLDTYINDNKNIMDYYNNIRDVIEFCNYRGLSSLIDAENNMPVKTKVIEKQINTELMDKCLQDYKDLTSLVLLVPEEHIKTVEERLKTIIKCLPKT